MNNPIPIIPAPRRVRRKRKQTIITSAPALVLISATYAPEQYVELTFDRAINVDGVQPTQFVIQDDEFSGWLAVGWDWKQQSPTTVRIKLDRADTATESGVHMTVSAGNGIVAVDDGGVWSGVTDLELPFG